MKIIFFVIHLIKLFVLWEIILVFEKIKGYLEVSNFLQGVRKMKKFGNPCFNLND